VSGFVLVFAPAAEADIADAMQWYRARNAMVADSFREQIVAAIDGIADDPLKHPPDAEGNRKRLLRRFPYSVFYEVVGSTVTVLAVAHQRRKPNDWRARRGDPGR
jgi:plasmid stabilization system protein ParE